MSGRFWAELWMVLALLVILTGLLGATGADLAIASHFYREGGWPVGSLQPWKFLYWLHWKQALLLALIGLVAVFTGWLKANARQWVRPGVFLVLLLVLANGLMVNALFKNHWDRPRPRDVVQFGGEREFRQPWQPGTANLDRGRSFPSGHAAAAFYMMAPFFIYRLRKPAVAYAWLIGGMLFGGAMSYARISQGGHFLTDTLWSWGMLYLAGLVLSELLLKQQRQVD